MAREGAEGRHHRLLDPRTGDAVSVRTTMADGTLLRSRQVADVETARAIAAEWLYAIRDLILEEGLSTHDPR